MVCSNALLAVLALATFAVGASEEAASLTHQSAANRYTHRRHSLRPPQHPRVPAVAKREEGKDIVALHGKLLPAVMPAAAAIPSNNTNRRAHLHHLAGSAIGASNAAPTSHSLCPSTLALCFSARSLLHFGRFTSTPTFYRCRGRSWDAITTTFTTNITGTTLDS